MVDGEARELLESAGGGVFVEPEDGRGFANAIEALIECGPEGRDRMGARGRAYVLAHYTREAQGRRLVGLLQSEVDGVSPP